MSKPKPLRIVVSMNRAAGEPLPTEAQCKRAAGKLIRHMLDRLMEFEASPWMTQIADVTPRKPSKEQ